MRRNRRLLRLAGLASLALGIGYGAFFGNSARAIDIGDYSGATNTHPAWLVKPTDHFADGETPQTFQGPVGRANCGPGSNPETGGIQGSVSVADRQSGRSSQGYWCNMEVVGNYGPKSPQPFEGAEWQFARYKDSAGHQCGYYSQRLAGTVSWFPATKSYVANGVTQARPGTVVVDITDPTNPTFVENIATPGMYNPWETLKVHQGRGLLFAVEVMDGQAYGFMGIYDLKQDCRHPQKLFDGATTVYNHEGNISYDGMTYYTGHLQAGVNLVNAIDVSDPRHPRLLGAWNTKSALHGFSTTMDSKHLIIAHVNEDWIYTTYAGKGGYGGQGYRGDEGPWSRPPPTNGDTILGGDGMGIYDVSEIQERKPNPQMRLISALESPDGQINQQSFNFVKDGIPYAMTTSEGGHGGTRIVDISDMQHPKVVTKIKTEIMMQQNNDRAVSETWRPPYEYGGDFTFAYNFHYCNTDKRIDPVMMACSAFEQGLRVFDIRDLKHPRELGYFNPGGDGFRPPGSWCTCYSAYAMAMPQFDPEHKNIWFTDNNRGVFVIHPTNGTWITDVKEEDVSHGN
jgi:hypothetical protein